MYVCMYVCMHVCAAHNALTDILTYIMHAVEEENVHWCMNVYVCMYMNVCMYECIYTYPILFYVYIPINLFFHVSRWWMQRSWLYWLYRDTYCYQALQEDKRMSVSPDKSLSSCSINIYDIMKLFSLCEFYFYQQPFQLFWPLKIISLSSNFNNEMCWSSIHNNVLVYNIM